MLSWYKITSIIRTGWKISDLVDNRRLIIKYKRGLESNREIWETGDKVIKSNVWLTESRIMGVLL